MKRSHLDDISKRLAAQAIVIEAMFKPELRPVVSIVVRLAGMKDGEIVVSGEEDMRTLLATVKRRTEAGP